MIRYLGLFMEILQRREVWEFWWPLRPGSQLQSLQKDQWKGGEMELPRASRQASLIYTVVRCGLLGGRKGWKQLPWEGLWRSARPLQSIPCASLDLGPAPRGAYSMGQGSPPRQFSAAESLQGPTHTFDPADRRPLVQSRSGLALRL